MTINADDMPAVETPVITEDRPSFTGDQAATWVYWNDIDPVKIPDEWVWERLRLRRDALLSATDFRTVPDAPWDVTPWLSYRESLRELPSQTTDPRLAVWPSPPQ